MDIQIITPPRANQAKMLDFGLVALTEAIAKIAPDTVGAGFLGGEFGYGANFDNDVFTMRTFYWGDCDCGFEERSERWHAANEHAAACFRTILHARFEKYNEESGYNAIDKALHAPGGMDVTTEKTPYGTVTLSKRAASREQIHAQWCAAHDKRNTAHARLTADAYAEFGLPISPYQWFCTCGVDKRAKVYFETEGHYPTCALELPNFLHKASGLEARWYKWIGRDMEVEIPDGADVAAVFRECVESLGTL